MQQERSGGEAFGAFLLGGAIGAIIALLTAPRSGQDSRRYLSRIGRDLKGTATDNMDRMKQGAKETGDQLKKLGNDAKEAARDTSQRIQYEGDQLAAKAKQSTGRSGSVQTGNSRS